MARGCARLFLLAACVLVAGCPRPSRTPAPITRPEEALAEFVQPLELRDDGDPSSLRAAITESLTWLATRPPEERFVYGPRQTTVAELRAALEHLRSRLTD